MRRWMLTALAIGCVPTGTAMAQSKPVPAEITKTFADWAARQKRLKTARYRITGTIEFRAAVTPDDRLPPAGDRVRPIRAMLLLDLERQRIRTESSEVGLNQEGQYLPREGIYTYNGEEVRQGQSRHIAQKYGGFDLIIAKTSKTRPAKSAANHEYWPVYFAHGIVGTLYTPLYLDELPLKLDPEDFVFVGRQTLRGRSCYVFRTEPLPCMSGTLQDEYWVDPARESAILRYVQLGDGKDPWIRLDIDWRQTPAGWWPEKWTDVWTANGKTVNRVETFHIESFEPNPAVTDADFTIPVEPGMQQVIVSELPEAGNRRGVITAASRTYRITDSGRWEEIAATPSLAIDGTIVPPRPKWGWIVWVVAAAIVMAVVCGVIVWRLRRRPV